MELTEWAKLQEELLKAQLGVIRGYLRSEEPGGRERKASQRKSQMSMVTDILSSAGTPLHVCGDHAPGERAVRGGASTGNR